MLIGNRIKFKKISKYIARKNNNSINFVKQNRHYNKKIEKNSINKKYLR